MFLLGPLKFSFYGFLFLNSQKVTQMVLTLNCNQNKAMTRRRIPVLWVLPNTPSFSSFTSLVAIHTHFPGSPALPQCSCWTGEQPQSPVRELCPISSTCLLQHSTTWEGCLAVWPYSELITLWRSMICEEVWRGAPASRAQDTPSSEPCGSTCLCRLQLAVNMDYSKSR